MNDLKNSFALCPTCNNLIVIQDNSNKNCSRCGLKVSQRKNNSIARTLALTLAALIFYIPANLYPIMTIESFNTNDPNTIIGGIISLFNSKMYFIGFIVFFASIAIPIIKIVILFYLSFCIKRVKSYSNKKRTKLYHLIEIIGKWSMLDIYVIAIMAGLVNVGYFIKVHGEEGATYFAVVVLLTMFAAKSFDTRIIWDQLEKEND